ncbi:MAG: hypothetical protein MK207_00985 [Saprospiraceae bacterium]|nr:hypothetical protein [Saprospiraceae bacterium]
MSPQIPGLNNLAKQVFEANKAKGFWALNRSSAEILVLILSEMFEALEAERKSKSALNLQACLDLIGDDRFKVFFVENIKDSFEDELADTVIRILDMAGAWEIELETIYLAPTLQSWSDQNISLGLMQREFFSFQSCVLEFSFIINQIIQKELQTTIPEIELAKGANQMLYFVLAVAKHYRVKVWDHVKIKLAYNATRAHKHGKKY